MLKFNMEFVSTPQDFLPSTSKCPENYPYCSRGNKCCGYLQSVDWGRNIIECSYPDDIIIREEENRI